MQNNKLAGDGTKRKSFLPEIKMTARNNASQASHEKILEKSESSLLQSPTNRDLIDSYVVTPTRLHSIEESSRTSVYTHKHIIMGGTALTTPSVIGKTYAVHSSINPLVIKEEHKERDEEVKRINDPVMQQQDALERER